MVDAPQPPPESSEKPFALRAVVFTVGFLALVLGLIPAVFHYLGGLPFRDWGFWAVAREFWSTLLHLIGIAVFSAGLIAYVVCSAWLIFFGRGPHVEFDPPKVFVANGPYRWVRNPVVITLILTVLGEAIVLASPGILVLVLLGMGFAQYQVTRIEEPRLRERFGESYEEYCRRVPRWIPRPPTKD